MHGRSKSKEAAQPDQPLSVMPSRRPETNLVRDDQRPDGKEPRESIFGPGGSLSRAADHLQWSTWALASRFAFSEQRQERASGLMFGGSQRS